MTDKPINPFVALRQSLGFTQQHAADAVGASRRSVQNSERADQPNPVLLNAVRAVALRDEMRAELVRLRRDGCEANTVAITVIKRLLE